MAQVRVWVPAAVMRRAQALMVQGTGPASSGLSVVLRSDFYESTVPLQVRFIFAFCCRFAGTPQVETPRCSAVAQRLLGGLLLLPDVAS